MSLLKKLRITDGIIFIAFLMALFWVVLRPSMDSKFSVYLIFIPLCITLIFSHHTYGPVIVCVFSLFFAYNLILTSLSQLDYFNFLVFQYHFLRLLVFCILTWYLLRRYNEIFIDFVIYKIFVPLIYLALLQWVFAIRFPNVNDAYTDGSVSSIFWNQNEFGLAMVAVMPFILLGGKHFLVKIIIISSILFLHFVNDSKLSLLSSVLVIFLYCFYFVLRLGKDWRSTSLLRISTLYIIFVCLFLLYWFKDYQIPLRDYAVTIHDWLTKPALAIINLEFLAGIGSREMRVNAIVYGLREYVSYGWVGVGFGNTVTLLAESEFSSHVRSMHNLPIQLIVELGIPIIILYIFVCLNWLRLLVWPKLTKHDALYLMAVPVFFIGSSGSSIGILSNFFFWFFFVSYIYIISTKTDTSSKVPVNTR